MSRTERPGCCAAHTWLSTTDRPAARAHTGPHAWRLVSQLTNVCVSLAQTSSLTHAVHRTRVHGERVHGVYHHEHYHVVCRRASRPWRGHDGESCLLRDRRSEVSVWQWLVVTVVPIWLHTKTQPLLCPESSARSTVPHRHGFRLCRSSIRVN